MIREFLKTHEDLKEEFELPGEAAADPALPSAVREPERAGGARERDGTP